MNKRRNKIIQGLWIGDKLSTFEQLSISSYLQNGFQYHLYTYGKVAGVPKGTKVKDARKILSAELIFAYANGSYSAFSNLFRFALLYKKGGIWSDLDMVCLKPFAFDQDYVFANEINNEHTNSNIGAFFIQAKPKSPAFKFAYEKCLQLRKQVINGEIQWGLGYSILKEMVATYDLQSFKQPWQTFTTCNWEQIESFLNPNYSSPNVPSRLEDIPEQTVAVHLWNEIFRRENVDKDKTYPSESILEKLKAKYL